MKNLIFILLFLFSFNLPSQNIVNIQITEITPTKVDVTLYPTYNETSVLSNVVFTLKWRNNQNIALGNPQSVNSLSMMKSGPVLTNGNWKYQIYNGLSFVSTNISQPITISIPKSGSGRPTIATDAFVNNIMVNGAYYVSIGGQDVTGQILAAKSLEIETDTVQNNLQYKMYYDQKLNQFLFEFNGVFYTTIGQKIVILDRTNLFLVKKN